MKKSIQDLLRITFIVLPGTSVSLGQKKAVCTKYVNTFIGTAPLSDPEILGYKLPDGWRSWPA
jgi:hypothetical protein